MYKNLSFINTWCISDVSKKELVLDDFTMKNDQFVLTKRIAKHGRQAVIVIPKILESELEPGTIVKMTLDIIKKKAEVEGWQSENH